MGATLLGFENMEVVKELSFFQKEDNLSRQAAGELLERVMRAAGYDTDEKLADAVNSTRPNIQKLRTGQSGGSPELWYKLSQVLGYPFENFMKTLVGMPLEPEQEDVGAVTYLREFTRLDPDERQVIKDVTRLYLRRQEWRANHDQDLINRVRAEMEAEARANFATEQTMRQAEIKATENNKDREIK